MYKVQTYLVPSPVRTQMGIKDRLAQTGCVGRLGSGKASQRARNLKVSENEKHFARLPRV